MWECNSQFKRETLPLKVKTCGVKTEKDLQNTLDTMYDKAKSGNEPFFNLIELMCNEQTIQKAINNIKNNKGSKTAGIDGKTVDDYLQMPYPELIDKVRNSIQNYNPSPVRRKYIEKASGKLRPLGIPVMLDRIVQEITRMVLEPIAEAKFYQYSFGFRPMRSASQAMAEIVERVRRNKTYWVIEGDIKGFFDNMNHNKLVEMLWNLGIKDKRLLTMIKKMLKSGVVEEDGRLYKSDLGSPQGGIVSPLLANIYLNNFDWMIAEKFLEHPHKKKVFAKYDKTNAEKAWANEVKKRHQEVFLVRYADDWVILCKTKQQAESIYKEVEKYFKHKLKIELSKEKTFITYIREKRAHFLGFEFFAEKARANNNIVGKIIPDIKRSTEKVREICKEIRHINKMKSKKPRDVALQIEKVNEKIVGLAQYYSIANCVDFFNAWNQRINHQQYKTWFRLTGEWRFKKNTIPANKATNRRKRHERRADRLYYVRVDNANIVVTKFSMTPSAKALKVNLDLTPYTEKGRGIHEKATGKKLPLIKNESLHTYDSLKVRLSPMKRRYASQDKYNFEYFMNRETVYNRDKGKCKCCGYTLFHNNVHVHHKNPNLPLTKINKTQNLELVCIPCHKLIHNYVDVKALLPKKVAERIESLRVSLKKKTLQREKQLNTT